MTTMAENKRIDEPTGTKTVGHEWDGIEELNTPLPRWWLLDLLCLHHLGDSAIHGLSGMAADQQGHRRDVGLDQPGPAGEGNERGRSAALR
jgi:hypothetical protein